MGGDELQEVNVESIPNTRKSVIGLIIRIAKDDGLGFPKRVGSNRLPILCHIAGTETVIARLVPDMNSPSTEHHWNWAPCRNPFAVIFAHEMQMGAGFITAYTCRMSNVIVAIDPLSNLDARRWGNVQID